MVNPMHKRSETELAGASNQQHSYLEEVVYDLIDTCKTKNYEFIVRAVATVSDGNAKLHKERAVSFINFDTALENFIICLINNFWLRFRSKPAGACKPGKQRELPYLRGGVRIPGTAIPRLRHV